MKTYVLPPTAAVLVATLVAMPALSSAYPVEQSRISLSSDMNSSAAHSYSPQRVSSSTGEPSAAAALTPVVPTPILLDVAGLPARVPLTAWNTFVTSLTQKLPQSLAATVQYAADVLYTYLTSVVSPDSHEGEPDSVLVTSAAGGPVTAAAATPPYDFLDVLGLPIQTAFAIVAGGTAGVTLPTSPLIPSPYTSVYTVINNAIAVLRVPLSLALTGQFSDIVPQTQAAFTTFATSLTQGLPGSIRGTLEWDLSVISGFLSGTTNTAVPTAESAATLSATAIEVEDGPKAIAAEQTGTATDTSPVVEATSASAEVSAPGVFVKRLQSAVDKHLSVPAVESADAAAIEAPMVETQPTEDEQSHESDGSEATADDAGDDAEGDKGAADRSGATDRKAERDTKSDSAE